MNLFSQIRAAIASPGKTFIETPAGAPMTYGDMLARSGQIANVLAARGVKPGDRVAAQVEKTPENLLLYLATLRAGAVFLPLNTAYTLAELDYFIGDSEPALIVCDPGKHAGFADIAGKRGIRAVETLDASGKGSLTEAAAKASPEFSDVVRGSNDLAAILYTSGTTGRSKGAMLTHDNLASNAETLADYWHFTDKDVLLHALPVYHTHGLFVASNTVMLSGGAMIFLSKFDADEVMRLLAEGDRDDGRADILYAAPETSRADQSRLQAHAPLHLRLGAAACRNAYRIPAENRSRHSRALRHDRDQHEYVEPL